jgi:hypothetical protein
VSNPDKLAELRNTVEIYEKECNQARLKMTKYSAELRKKNQEVFLTEATHTVEMSNKLIDAYKKYVAALEQFVPR